MTIRMDTESHTILRNSSTSLQYSASAHKTVECTQKEMEMQEKCRAISPGSRDERLHRRRMMRIDVAGTRARGGRPVNGVAKLLRRLEEGDTFGWHIHLGSGLGIAPGPGVALSRPKASEPTDFNLVTGFQCPDDGIKQGIDDDFAIAACKVA